VSRERRSARSALRLGVAARAVRRREGLDTTVRVTTRRIVSLANGRAAPVRDAPRRERRRARCTRRKGVSRHSDVRERARHVPCLAAPRAAHMFRVQQTSTSGRIRIAVQGRLSSETIAVLQAACDGAPVHPRATLDLSELKSVDHAGRECLLRLRANGHELVGGSLYIRQLLTEDEP
jgi:hypothetical protein